MWSNRFAPVNFKERAIIKQFEEEYPDSNIFQAQEKNVTADHTLAEFKLEEILNKCTEEITKRKERWVGEHLQEDKVNQYPQLPSKWTKSVPHIQELRDIRARKINTANPQLTPPPIEAEIIAENLKNEVYHYYFKA
jgi:hypothetical protein